MHDHPIATTHSAPATWWVLLPLAIAAALYLVAAIRQGWPRRGRRWSPWRTAAWMLGIALIGIAISPPLASAAHTDLRMHMVQHLTLGMLAPLGLVLAAPVTLLLRTVPVDTGRALSRILRSRPLHALSHPLTALVLTIGGMALLYLSPLFAWSMDRPWLHWLINLHFLAAGYLFAWSIAGPDPAPRRPGIVMRAAVLVLSLGLHAFLGKLMYAHLLPRDVPFSPDEIREAAVLMYYGGDVAELLLAIALFASWYTQRRRQRQRHSRPNAITATRKTTPATA